MGIAILPPDTGWVCSGHLNVEKALLSSGDRSKSFAGLCHNRVDCSESVLLLDQSSFFKGVSNSGLKLVESCGSGPPISSDFFISVVSSLGPGPRSGSPKYDVRAKGSRVFVQKETSNEKYEKLFRDLFSNPSQWWDNRSGKPNARFPDFKHKQTGQGLWLSDIRNPSWVASEIASLPRGLSVFWGAERLSKCNKAGQYEKTVEFFHQMQEDGLVIDGHAFVQVLNACAASQDLEEGRRIHGQIIKSGCEVNQHLSSSLVDMYTKCGSIDEAWRVFDKMPTRNVVVWTVMILGYVKCGECLKALQLFHQMQQEGVTPDSVTFVGLLNACASIEALEEGRLVHQQIIQSGVEVGVHVGSSLVHMYSKCGSIDDAWEVFDMMPVRNVVAWTAMVVGCVKCERYLQALDLFQKMQGEGVKPNSVTYLGALNACAGISALEKGRSVHKLIIQSGCESEVNVSNSLIDMYAKCGSIVDARRVFDDMCNRNVVTWNVIIMGYALHGDAREAVTLFEQMDRSGLEIDSITFVGLLTACNHGGLVTEGVQYFESMLSIYGILPGQEHYICMVDALGRAGKLVDAEALVTSMPFRCTSAWVCLLSACRIHGDMEMGERISKRVLELDPTIASGYVLLSSMHAAAGNLEANRWSRKSY